MHVSRKLSRAFRMVVMSLMTVVLAGCVFMRDDSNFGVHALCQATGKAAACLSTGDVISLQKTTGYLDVARSFPNVVRGVGSVLQASDAFGLRYLGNALECLPESFRPTQQIEVVSPPARRRSWSEVDDYVIFAGAFVQLEQPEKLGPAFGDIRAVHVQVRSVQRAFISADSLQHAISAAYPVVSTACREALLAGDYIVIDALRVGEVAYTFMGKSGKRIPTSLEKLPNYLVPNSQSGIEIEGNRLVTRVPKYFAIGQVIPIGDDSAVETDLIETLARHCKYVRNCYYY